jgi:HEAT repeat protein
MAAFAIGSLGSRRAAPRLLDLTQDTDWFVRVAALNGLGYIDEALPAEPALVAIGDNEPLVRQAAALNMGGSSDPAAVEVLLDALVHDSDWAVRESAADVLGQIGDPRAVESLRRAGASGAWSSVGAWFRQPAVRFTASRPPTTRRLSPS